ncbi:MAG: type I glutamate--ammonia ligase [Armatimonadota bacterium]|nr:type I glutamate--ammonia ligase [Armatimonadota bacterium]MCX7776998.1 type I glutamate--ammonia ligase [Armatimonadota bacterium]MDW8024832.1 type I glutamate--ammonia ligase [Armatimonadota bacterium]
MPDTPSEVIAMARQENVQVIDLRFTDLLGTWQHFSISLRELSEELFEDGVGFDGSSIRGFQEIHESDMILIPDPKTAFVDPFLEVPTMVIICDVVDPITRERYSRDPRYIAQKAERYLVGTGIADTSYWGPEAEFFIFNDVRYDVASNYSYYFVDSHEGIWNSGRDENPNLAHKLRYKEGYFPTPPSDTLQDIRSEIMLTLERIGIPCEVHHHEVATGGQGEVDLHYDTLTRMADKVMMFKYVVKMVARRHGMTATFMPKPLFGDNGSGMHTHQSLWRRGVNLFYDEGGYAQLSEIGRYYIGGLLRHAPALLAFCAPTVNSYRRLVPGYEAPVRLAYSQRNRSACIRIPVYSRDPKEKRIEFRPPDPSCNPYIAFAAMLMAGIDGVLNRIDPGEPVDKNIYDLPPEEAKAIPMLPSSLEEALRCLEADYTFLLRGDVFTEDVIQMWIDFKRREINALSIHPHPYEFYLYYDA